MQPDLVSKTYQSVLVPFAMQHKLQSSSAAVFEYDVQLVGPHKKWAIDS